MIIKRLPKVEAETGLARSTVWLHVKRKLLPPPIKIGPRAVGWIAAEIDAVISARIKGADDNAIRAIVSDLVEARQAA